MKKVAVIGHFGGKENFSDGQTIKTKVLYSELKNLNKFKLYTADTYYVKKNPIKLILQTLKCLILCKSVFILLSCRGMKIYFPFLYYWNKVFKNKIYHDVIGGNLAQVAKKYSKYRKYLNSFEINYVELRSMAEELEKLGVKNAVQLPNFKRLQVVPFDSIKPYENENFKFCTFSRVMKEKGIETAIDAIEAINKKAGKKICSLDIYGPVDAGYEERFEILMKNVTDAISYKGIIPFDQSVNTIKNYYALLFPTFWDGEGFAGTIIDAFASAVPVIATDWNLNSEIVTHMKTGIVYPNDKQSDLISALNWAIENKDQMYQMRLNCANEYQKYDTDILISQIIEKID